MAGLFFTTFWTSVAYSGDESCTHVIWPMLGTHHLPSGLVEIPVAVRQVVDPRAHEVLGEKHGHVVRVHARQRFLEHLEAPVLALGGRCGREQRFCEMPILALALPRDFLREGSVIDVGKLDERHKPSTTIRKKSGKDPLGARAADWGDWGRTWSRRVSQTKWTCGFQDPDFGTSVSSSSSASDSCRTNIGKIVCR